MPRFMVPRSTRTMYGTVRPCVVVVVARSPGVVPCVYGLKQLLAGGAAGGLGSGSAFEQPAVVVRWNSLYSVAMLHCASTAKVVRPLALDAGVLPEAGTGVGVAQIHGWVCEPSRIGPPRTWLVIVRLPHGRPLPLPLASATKVFSPETIPVSTPRRVRLSWSATKEAPTSAPLSVSVTFFIGTVLGTWTSTSASPSLTRSARLDSVRISKLNGGSSALASAALASAPSGIAAPPPNPATTSSAMPSAPIRTPWARLMMSPPSCTPRLRNRLDANAPTAASGNTLLTAYL